MPFLLPSPNGTAEDGYTLEGRIPPRAGLHGEVRFTYRPALPRRVARWQAADRDPRLSDDQRFDALLDLLAEHVAGWTEKEAVSRASLERVPTPALTVLADHVCGYTATVWEGKEKN